MRVLDSSLSSSSGVYDTEVLVVVAIIALLVAIMMPSFEQAREHQGDDVLANLNRSEGRQRLHHQRERQVPFTYARRTVYPAAVVPFVLRGQWLGT
jgi:Tfp pilus assembly protein PilE